MAADDVANAFDLIGHPDRLSIVEVLINARRSDGDPHVRFTDLRDRSRIDDTGRFNYHLERLRGTFVAKTDEGYRLSGYGRRLMAPMMGGGYDADSAPDPIETPGTCHECGGALRIRPDETILQVVCEAGHVVNRGLIGYPGIVRDRQPADASRALGLLNRQGVERALAGVCPTCHGPIDGEIAAVEAGNYYAFKAPCDACGNQFAATVGACVLTRPAVASFLQDRGIDVRRVVPWSLPFVAPGSERLDSRDPFRLSIDVTGDDASLTVTVDRAATVVSTNRHAR